MSGIKLIVFAILILSACSHLPEAQATADAEFEKLQKSYFPLLDLRARPEQIAKIPAFSKELSLLADRERSVLQNAKNGSLSETQKAQIGLILTYDAMMTANIAIGIDEGLVNLPMFKEARTYALDDKSPKAELLSRMSRALDELEMAKTLRPDDFRVRSWLVGVKVAKEIIAQRQPSTDSLNRSVKTIAEHPTFNLWTSIISFRDQEPGTDGFQKLTDQAVEILNAPKTSAESCQDNLKSCDTAKRVRYRYPASVVMLGDVFLRRAQYLQTRGDKKLAKKLLNYAVSVYSQLSTPENLAITKAWPDNIVINDRLQAMREFSTSPDQISHVLARAQTFKRAYECSSCHGRNL